MSRVAMRRHVRGFTLVELMITMAVALVLIMIAVPSFRTMTLSNKLTTTVNDMVGAINLARVESVKRNANVQFCSNLAASNTTDPLGAACGTQTGAVIAMAGTVAQPVGTGTVDLVDPLQLSGNVKAIRFGGQGLGYAIGATGPYTGLVADICTSGMSSNNHRQINMTAGSIIVTTTTSGTCP
ncbi:MAG: GspH/FimT family pseudopilin [Rhodanobacter sp.]|nr:GspH/FimT family pseudopilin [Rhodanobacter sp.]